jgi:hypothetical protein
LSNVEISHHKNKAGPEMVLPSISQISNLNQILRPEDNQQSAELSTALIIITTPGTAIIPSISLNISYKAITRQFYTIINLSPLRNHLKKIFS